MGKLDKAGYHSLWVLFPFLFFVIGLILLPFSFFVDVKSIKYQNMCVGSDTQIVIADRDVKWVDAYRAKTTGELFKFEDDKKIEMIHKREVKFVYQISETPVSYQVKWSQPIEEVGIYGASDYVQMEVFLINKTHFSPAQEQMFEVIEC